MAARATILDASELEEGVDEHDKFAHARGSVVHVMVGACGARTGLRVLHEMVRESPLVCGAFQPDPRARPDSKLSPSLQALLRVDRTDVRKKVARTVCAGPPRMAPKELLQGPTESVTLCAPSNLLTDPLGGCNNNWAIGYTRSKAPPPMKHGGFSLDDRVAMRERIWDSVRREAERCDTLGGFMVHHSLGGGTGAGLGSRVVEELRDEYRSTTLMCSSVLPFSSGDTPLQSYNEVLALSRIQPQADAIAMLSNDSATEVILGKAAAEATRRRSELVSMADINTWHARNMCAALMSDPTGTMPVCLKEFADRISTPDRNLLSISGAPVIHSAVPGRRTGSARARSSDASAQQEMTVWVKKVERALRGIPKFHAGARNKTFSRPRLILRTASTGGMFSSAPSERDISDIEHTIHGHFNVQTNPEIATLEGTPESGVTVPTGQDQLGLVSCNSATMVCNSSANVQRVEHAYASAVLKFEKRAYWHWYERFGVTGDDFAEALESVQTIIDRYSAFQ